MEDRGRTVRKTGLKRLISRKEEASVLEDILVLAGGEIAINGADGSLLAGKATPDVTKIPVEFAGETIGWVSGGEKAQRVAAFLRYLYAAETQKKSLVSDALEKYKEITFLYDIGEKIAACLDVKEVARLVIDEARRVIRADNVSLMLLNEETDELHILNAWGKESAQKLAIKKGEGIAGDVLLTGRAEIVNDVLADRRFIRGECSLQSLICVPMGSNDRVIGVLNISCENAHNYVAEDLKLATALAFQASMSMENARYVAELKDSEKKYRVMYEKYHSLFENSLEGIFQTSFDGVFISANPAMAKICGYSSVDELLTSVTDIASQLYVHPEDRQAFMTVTIQEGRVIDFETQWYRKDRSRTWVSLSARAVYENGALLFYEGSATDISERKEKEEEKKAREAAELRNQFIRETFGRYLSDDIVHNILETPGGLKLGGDKRIVTILMSDLRGFTSIGERSSAEDVVGMINNYLSVMTEIILKYNGTIDEFIGDAILVIFGAPIQRDDDAIRAVACGVEMQLAMAEVNRRNRAAGYHEVAMGIGINTGSVVVGNIGSNKRTKYAVVGRNVNLTSRIESYTVGGQILASASTVEACGGILRIDNTMEVMPKGVQNPLTIHDVGGIGGNCQLFLPAKSRRELPELERPLPIRFKVLDGKNVAGEAIQGRILKFAAPEAEIHADLITDRLTNLKITLAGSGNNEKVPELYGKVTENISAVPPLFRVCLTSTEQEVQAFLEAAGGSDGKARQMTIKFVGVGSQFAGQDYYHSNLLVTAKTGKKLLIDCGSDIRFALREAGIPLADIASEIDAVYISHLHSDHIGGIETIALCTYFNPAGRKPKLFGEEKLLGRLWRDSLKGGLQCIQGRAMELEDYFECCPVADSGAFIWEGITFRLIKMPHIQSDQRDHDSYGLGITEPGEGVNVFFSSDTQFRPELIREIAAGADLIFHDCETSPFKTGVHAHYTELCTLPAEVKQKIWLYHYQPDPVYNPEADGFRGFVSKGQEFEIKHLR